MWQRTKPETKPRAFSKLCAKRKRKRVSAPPWGGPPESRWEQQWISKWQARLFETVLARSAAALDKPCLPLSGETSEETSWSLSAAPGVTATGLQCPAVPRGHRAPVIWQHPQVPPKQLLRVLLLQERGVWGYAAHNGSDGGPWPCSKRKCIR